MRTLINVVKARKTGEAVAEIADVGCLVFGDCHDFLAWEMVLQYESARWIIVRVGLHLHVLLKQKFPLLELCTRCRMCMRTVVVVVFRAVIALIPEHVHAGTLILELPVGELKFEDGVCLVALGLLGVRVDVVASRRAQEVGARTPCLVLLFHRNRRHDLAQRRELWVQGRKELVEMPLTTARFVLVWTRADALVRPKLVAAVVRAGVPLTFHPTPLRIGGAYGLHEHEQLPRLLDLRLVASTCRARACSTRRCVCSGFGALKLCRFLPQLGDDLITTLVKFTAASQPLFQWCDGWHRAFGSSDPCCCSKCVSLVSERSGTGPKNLQRKS